MYTYVHIKGILIEIDTEHHLQGKGTGMDPRVLNIHVHTHKFKKSVLFSVKLIYFLQQTLKKANIILQVMEGSKTLS